MATPTPRQMAEMAAATKGTLQDSQLYNQGKAEGRSECRKEVLTWLEKKYTGPGAPERGSVEGKAILQLTMELSQFLQPKR